MRWKVQKLNDLFMQLNTEEMFSFVQKSGFIIPLSYIASHIANKIILWYKIKWEPLPHNFFVKIRIIFGFSHTNCAVKVLILGQSMACLSLYMFS